MAEKELTFQTTLKELPVTIDGKAYVLRELDGGRLSQHREMLGGEISVGEDNKPILRNLDLRDPEVRLLKLCLYDGDGKLVPEAVMRGWPSTVLGSLYDAAQELSGLTDKASKQQKDKAKNS